jgi:hypothetical protein
MEPSSRPGRIRLAALCLVMGAASCTAGPDASGAPGAERRAPAGAATSSTAASTAPVAAGCGSGAVTNSAAGPELRGTGTGVTLYGLLMPTAPLPVRAGDEVKIVWRMTGSGPLRLSFTGPRGQVGTLQWGPEPHGGSTYDRPGEEWGAGYRFPVAGCWRLHAERTTGSADAWLPVSVPIR